MNRAKATHPDQLRDSTCVLAVGLHRHGGQRRLHVAGLQKNRLEASLRQPRMQSLRQGTSLYADPHYFELTAFAGRLGGHYGI